MSEFNYCKYSFKGKVSSETLPIFHQKTKKIIGYIYTIIMEKVDLIPEIITVQVSGLDINV